MRVASTCSAGGGILCRGGEGIYRMEWPKKAGMGESQPRSAASMEKGTLMWRSKNLWPLPSPNI